jgi:negative regulator of sigma-B (phosphoserine phosphatase)
MASAISMTQSRIHWSAASKPKPGQEACGDLYLVKVVEDAALLAVVDGLGHGTEAIIAAQRAVEILEQHASEPLITLVHRCHEALSRTRGAVMTLAAVQLAEGTMTWMGVGNVEGWLFRAGTHSRRLSERVLLRSGVVGYNLPVLHSAVLPVAEGDLLLFATDGIRSGFTEQLKLASPPADIVKHVLAQDFKGTDDALVLAVRYLGKAYE